MARKRLGPAPKPVVAAAPPVTIVLCSLTDTLQLVIVRDGNPEPAALSAAFTTTRIMTDEGLSRVRELLTKLEVPQNEAGCWLMDAATYSTMAPRLEALDAQRRRTLGETLAAAIDPETGLTWREQRQHDADEIAHLQNRVLALQGHLRSMKESHGREGSPFNPTLLTLESLRSRLAQLGHSRREIDKLFRDSCADGGMDRESIRREMRRNLNKSDK